MEEKASNTLDIHQRTADNLGIPREFAKSINFALLYGSDITKKPLWKLYNLLRRVAQDDIEYDSFNTLRWGDITIGMNSENTFYVCDGIANIVDDNLNRVAECAIRVYYNNKIDKMIKVIYE